jgi:hypothetical protein
VTSQLVDGRVLLDVKGQALEARTSLPLSAGQSIQLEVAGLGPVIALRVLNPPQVVSEQNLALGALATAHASSPPAPPPDVGALLRALDVEVATLSTAQRTEITRLLAPLRADVAAAPLAAELRHILENGGLLFESRVREWLQSAAPEVQPGQGLPTELASDLKVLLGMLGRALPRPPTHDEPVVTDSLQRRAVALVQRELQAVDLGDRPALETLRTEHARIRDELLSRQVETAYHWVRDGTLSMRLPLAFGDHVAHAWLRFHRGVEDQGEGVGGARPGIHAFDLALEPPGIGPVRAHVAWSGRHLRVQFFVAADPAAAAIAPALPELSSALVQSGFSKVDTGVTVDAARSRLGPLAPMAPPSGGSILNLRA